MNIKQFFCKHVYVTEEIVGDEVLIHKICKRCGRHKGYVDPDLTKAYKGQRENAVHDYMQGFLHAVSGQLAVRGFTAESSYMRGFIEGTKQRVDAKLRATENSWAYVRRAA